MRTTITEQRNQHHDLDAQCVEYGAMARSAAGTLFVRGWDQSGHRAWIMVCDTRLEHEEKAIESPPLIVRGYIVTLTAATVERRG